MRKNKQKPRLPTVEEFLEYKPLHQDFKWEENKEGLVTIQVPKFERKIGKSFCKLIKKDQNFTANLEKIGSVVWKNCDGKKTVKQILNILKKEFPKEENIDQRLFLFLQQMHSLNYLDY